MNDGYVAHRWKLYDIAVQTPEQQELRAASIHAEETLYCCAGALGMPRYNHGREYFFHNVEYESVGLSPTLGVMDIRRLVTDWRGHKPGSLIVESPTGCDLERLKRGERPWFTYMVENL